jgi:hypothetical protein
MKLYSYSIPVKHRSHPYLNIPFQTNDSLRFGKDREYPDQRIESVVDGAFLESLAFYNLCMVLDQKLAKLSEKIKPIALIFCSSLPPDFLSYKIRSEAVLNQAERFFLVYISSAFFSPSISFTPCISSKLAV